jgi:transposase
MVVPAEVEELIASLMRRIAALEAEVAELRRQLGRDSSNSSKPPSSDGLKKKPRLPGSLRGRSGKASGGQTGHEGGTLRQVADPDCVVRHEACACGHCGLPLDPKSGEAIEKRQVFDLVERPLLVTEHQASIYRCENCRGVTKAAFPDGVVSPVQYGERVKAAAVYLNIQQLIPEDRTAQALSDLFGAPLICPASVVAWVGKKAQELGRSTRSSASGSPRRRFAISTKPGFASPASCNGCIPRRAWPSPSIAPTKSAARSLSLCAGASSCTTISCRIAGSMRSTTPSATPTSCANLTA